MAIKGCPLLRGPLSEVSYLAQSIIIITYRAGDIVSGIMVRAIRLGTEMYYVYLPFSGNELLHAEVFLTHPRYQD